MPSTKLLTTLKSEQNKQPSNYLLIIERMGVFTLLILLLLCTLLTQLHKSTWNHCRHVNNELFESQHRSTLILFIPTNFMLFWSFSMKILFLIFWRKKVFLYYALRYYGFENKQLEIFHHSLRKQAYENN